MKTKKTITLLLFSLIGAFGFSQNSVIFKNFTVKDYSYSTEAKLNPKDSFAIKKYILVNHDQDTLYLFQRVTIYMVNGKLSIFEAGLTDRFLHLRKDSAYTIYFEEDKYNLKKSTVFLKNKEVDFLYKKKSGEIIKTDSTNNLILSDIRKAEGLSISSFYNTSLDTIQKIITGSSIGSFKRANFIVENTFLKNSIAYEDYNSKIQNLATKIVIWLSQNKVTNYKYQDSISFLKNYAIYHFIKDTTTFLISNAKTKHLPYTYNFNDYNGSQDWSNMFVTKLLATHKGNCHSLPYLYKILADELGATCWLSLAPNHIYIKNRCKKIGWYNTELTSGTFPIDAWIMASGYMPLQSIQNKLYMDTLSNQQAIALCVLDLAKGYEHQTKNYTDGFILKCCELVLKYHPTNPMALLLKAETLKQIYLHEQAAKYPKPTITFNQMQDFYAKLFDLGYREMPEKMYLNWLQSLNKEKEKYNNKKLKATLQGK